MTRRDTIIKWTAYLLTLWLVAMVNYYVLGPLPIALPMLLPILAVAGGRWRARPSARSTAGPAGR